MAGFDLKGARVLLTGATGGLGHAIAKELHARGASLILTGRKVDVLDELAKELGGDVTTVAADLADPDSIDRLMDAAGQIDVLVANAALPASGDPLEYSPEEITRCVTTNLQAPILLARAAAIAMRERRRGHIVFMGSLAGVTASPGTALYNATKFGLRGFALAFREDLSDAGVGVSIVEPGFVRDAGMFAMTDTKLPRGVRTVSPEACGQAVVAAIEHNKAEVRVAPIELRFGAAFGSLFPSVAAAVQRRVGADEVSRSLAEGHRHLR
jgi:short-subunit dehydrogenase